MWDELTLHRWRSTPPWRQVLGALSWGYRMGAYGHEWVRRGYRPYVPSVPTVVVGGIQAGGTGKTQVVQYIAQYLLSHGLRVGVLARGYGRMSREEGLLPPEAEVSSWGDEMVMLQRQLPQLVGGVGTDRVKIIKMLEKQGVDVILLDDGLQDHGVGRHLEVVVVSGDFEPAREPFLPLGDLRFPPERLQDVDLVWVHGPGSSARGQVTSQTQILSCRDRLTGQYEPLPARVGILTSIARPHRVRVQLIALGVEVVYHHAFPDHAPLAAHHWLEVARTVTERGALALVCTPKDAVKLPPELEFPLPLKILQPTLDLHSGGEVLVGFWGRLFPQVPAWRP